MMATSTMCSFTIVELKKMTAPQKVLVADRINLSNVDILSNYYAEYYNDKFSDHSFIVLDAEKLVGYVGCCQLEGKLCLPGTGISVKIFVVEPKKTAQIYRLILGYLHELAINNYCTDIIFKDDLSKRGLSNWGEILFNERYHANITFEMLISFEEFNVINYHKELRKSYAPLINWGKKNLETNIVDKTNPSIESFTSFKHFHHKISGRQTRSDESWDIQYQMLLQGVGELILGYYQKTLVAGSLFVNNNDTTVYSTGVYERSLFNFGLSHYLLYFGICRAYQRNTTKCFSLGFFDTDIQDQKWYNIQFFKKGFCQELAPILLWRKAIKKE